MDTQHRVYIWAAIGMARQCLFIPHLRMVVCQSLKTRCRIIMRLTNGKQHVCRMTESLAMVPLDEWWTRIMHRDPESLSRGCTCGRDCDTIVDTYGPIIFDRIYRYGVYDIYTDRSYDVVDQRRLLTFTCTSDLPRDVTMYICVSAFLMMCNDSVMQVKELW